MAVNEDREIIIQPVDGPAFKKKFRELRAQHPSIAESMSTFNVVKRKIPPESLPHGMKDHKLLGRLAGIRECHLAPNVLLLYKSVDNLVLLLDICTHDELK